MSKRLRRNAPSRPDGNASPPIRERDRTRLPDARLLSGIGQLQDVIIYLIAFATTLKIIGVI